MFACETDMNYGGEQWQEALMTQPSLEKQQSEKGEGGVVTNCIQRVHLEMHLLETRITPRNQANLRGGEFGN